MRRPLRWLVLTCLFPIRAFAQDATLPAPAAADPAVAPAAPTPPPAAPAEPAPVAAAPKKPVVVVLPAPNLPAVIPPKRTGFVIDPVTDGAIISLSVGFGVVSEFILSTGEIRPQQPQESSKLLAIDRVALTYRASKSAGPLSHAGLGLGMAFAVADPLLDWLRFDKKAMGADFTLYAETIAVTFATTNLAKIAVRRPRPRAYVEERALEAQFGADNPGITNTDDSMSFFSSHAALVSAVGSTATYLAFARSPKSIRPWLTMGGFLALETFVSIERVRAQAHFPTDVIAGSLAGIGIGLLVPHLHRYDEAKARSLWVGFGGSQATLSGTF